MTYDLLIKDGRIIDRSVRNARYQALQGRWR